MNLKLDFFVLKKNSRKILHNSVEILENIFRNSKKERKKNRRKIIHNSDEIPAKIFLELT
jgi:hypothetical protein